MTLDNFDCDVAIVGGGIVGTTLACALKDSGLRIILIESQPLDIAASRRQAYALTLLSGQILTGLGVWQEIKTKIAKFKHIRLSDGNFSGIVQFFTQDLQKEFLGYVGEHQIILTALQKAIASSANIDWLCPAKVQQVEYNSLESATLKVETNGETRSLTTKLVIGADGAKSPIRIGAGITTRGWKYPQSCVAFTIKHNAPSNDIAFERFWPTGPMGVLPLSDNRCQIVWTMPNTEATALQSLEESEFISKLEYYTGGLLGKIELISPRVVFPVQLMQSNSYIGKRLALIGDAAHCCHPVGGQGLNLGIRDAAALAEVLIKARAEGKDIGAIEVLRGYQRWRGLENLLILAMTDLLNRSFSNNWLPMVFLRRIALWLMQQIPFLKIYILKLMTGLKGRTPEIAKTFTPI